MPGPYWVKPPPPPMLPEIVRLSLLELLENWALLASVRLAVMKCVPVTLTRAGPLLLLKLSVPPPVPGAIV